MGKRKRLWLSEESRGDVAHVCLLKLVVFTVHTVDADKLESGNDPVDVETHVAEAVDQLFVVALVAVDEQLLANAVHK